MKLKHRIANWLTDGALSRLYHAARPSRLTSGWSTTTGTADSEIRASLTNLRSRSRALIRDSSYAKRARLIVVNNVIGGGMGLQAQVKNARRKLMPRVNDGIEEAWEKWTRAEHCHVGASLHFADIERLAMGEVFESGEVFIREHRRKIGDSDVPYALEVIESERVPHDQLMSIRSGTGNEVRLGVEVDEYYKPLRYFFRTSHPSDYQFITDRKQNEVFPVPADEIIHLRLVDRWPQIRGVPWLHTAARKLNDMDGYSESEIVAARAAAAYVGSYEGTGDMYGEVDRKEDGTYETEISPGIILNPPAGKKFNLHAPNRPNSALDPFMRYMLREVAAGIGVSYESLSRDYSQSNYSSSRLSLLDDRDTWRVLQMWFIRALRQRVHQRWLDMAVLSNAIPAINREQYMANPDKFFAAKFKARGWSWIDPTKEVAAYKEAIKGGLTTRTAVIAMTGGGVDVEDVDDERREELDNAKEKGLSFDTDPGQNPEPAKAGQPAEPSADPGSDQQDNNTDGGSQGSGEEDRHMRAVK